MRRGYYEDRRRVRSINKKNSAIMHEYTRRIWAHEPTKDLEAILFGETNQP
jgi:hypothetical protein